MAETPNPLRPVLRVAVDGGALTPAELRVIREHVATVGYEPGATKRVSSDMVRKLWSGGVVKPRDRLPAGERDYIKHARAGEWPESTTIADFLRTIRESILLDDGGIFIDQSDRNSLELTFISFLPHCRGLLGSGWVLVGFDVDYGWWTTAFQPVDGPRYVTDRTRSGVGRWLTPP